MSNFRIILDLHHYFNDYRAESYIYINTDCIKTIKHLRNHVQKVLQLNEKFDFLLGKGYLPSREDVRILQEENKVVAIPRSFRSNRSKYESSDKSTLVVRHEEVAASTHSSNKEETEVKVKKKNTSTPLVEANRSGCQKQFFHTPKPHVLPLAISSKPKIVKPILITGNYTADSITETLTESNCDSNDEKSISINLEPPKRKRIRKRKKKDKEEVRTFTPVYTEPSVLLTNTGENKHIRFQEAKESSEMEHDAEQVDSTLVNGLTHLTNGHGSQEMENVPTISLCNESDQISEESIAKCPLITDSRYQIGDVIAFKILKISETYTPEISKYITAKVNNIIDEHIALHILSGVDELAEPQGKFSLESADESTAPSDYDRVLCITDLVDARLLFP